MPPEWRDSCDDSILNLIGIKVKGHWHQIPITAKFCRRLAYSEIWAEKKYTVHWDIQRWFNGGYCPCTYMEKPGALSFILYIKTKYVLGKTEVKNDYFVIYTISNSEEVWVTIGHWYSAPWRVVIFVKYIWIKVGYGVDSSHVSQLLKFLFILPQVLYSPPALVNPRSFFTTKNWLLSKCLIHATCYFMRRWPCVWKTNSRNKYIWELVCVQAMLGLPRWLSR